MATGIADEPDDLLHEIGLGLANQRLWRVAAILGSCGTLLFASTTAAVLYVKPMIVRVPMVYDQNFQLLGAMTGESDPQLVTQIAVERAQEWVELYRGRTRNKDEMETRLTKLARLTDQAQWRRMDEKLAEHRKEFGLSTVDILEIGATPILGDGTKGNRVQVDVRWTERVQGGIDKAEPYKATVVVVFVPRSTFDDWGKNYGGFFVVDASIAKVIK